MFFTSCEGLKAVSNVVSLVIVLTVSIALAIAVSYLISSLPQQYTRLEIVGSYAYSSGEPSIVIIIRNTGSREVSLVDIHLNDVPVESLIPEKVSGVEPELPIVLSTGVEKRVEIHLKADKWPSGQTVGITLHTSTGYRYHLMVTI